MMPYCWCDVSVDLAGGVVLGGEHGRLMDRSRSMFRSGQRGVSLLPPLLLCPSFAKDDSTASSSPETSEQTLAVVPLPLIPSSPAAIGWHWIGKGKHDHEAGSSFDRRRSTNTARPAAPQQKRPYVDADIW